MKSEPKWPVEASNSRVSEFYSGYNKSRSICITAFNDWAKEQKPVVLPERKSVATDANYHHGKCVGHNECIDEFLRLNPQLNRKEP